MENEQNSMSNKIKNAIGDLNNDGIVDEKDAQIAKESAVKAATQVGEQVSRFGKIALSSDLAKDVVAFGALGAIIAVPVPFIGPVFGGAVGAGLGVFKNLSRKPGQAPIQMQASQDVYSEILKFEDLRQKGIISDIEFEAQKKKLMGDTGTL
jgi:hypothetical protein